MKFVSKLLILVFASTSLFAQTKKAEDFGYKHIKLKYNNDPVEILIKSKKGDEQKPKPLFLFCQGSMPMPLIKYDEIGEFGVFPFNPDSLSLYYHIVIIGKPFIPLICEAKSLRNDFTFIDSTGNFPQKYSERNFLDYYVNRNIEVIEYLQKQNWVDKDKLVVAGHSEGSTVAAKMAALYPKITQLIYASGNPMGRILSIIQENRLHESDTDSTRFAEFEIDYWNYVVKDKTSLDASQGDSYKATYDFSIPPINYLENLTIPVLVCYGTKDYSMPYNDYLRVDMIRKNKTNFSFKAYIGCEHNFFPIKSNGKPDYSVFNWNKVTQDWSNWLKK
ncbi:MAG: acyl-CoA thioester hydrolase/BAAT C-terminal domain-containing protein [Bacteroidota bacterium]